jgi:hypothetical protein
MLKRRRITSVSSGEQTHFRIIILSYNATIIRDAVEEVNRHAPQHSRIFKEVGIFTLIKSNERTDRRFKMILIAIPEKQFEYTPKGSVRRQITLKKYVEEIERLYEATESEPSTNEALVDVSEGKVPELDEFLIQVRTAVHTILGDSVGDDDDLFRAGADR